MGKASKNFLLIFLFFIAVKIIAHFFPLFDNIVTWVCFAVIAIYTILAIIFDHSWKNVLSYIIFLVVITAFLFI